MLDRFPNVHVELGARIGELGRQPRRSRRFFERYQDRILFGTDAVPNGHETPQQVFGDALYQIYYRFLETEDEYFDYAPAPMPPQGRWQIYGLGLPEGILKKVYHDNAARVLGIKASGQSLRAPVLRPSIVVVCVEAVAVRGQPPRILVLDHARVIDGTGEAAQNDMRVTIRDDRIESVQPSGKGEVLTARSGWIWPAAR